MPSASRRCSAIPASRATSITPRPRINGASIYMGDPGDTYRNPKELGQETVGIYVIVEDVDAHYERGSGRRGRDHRGAGRPGLRPPALHGHRPRGPCLVLRGAGEGRGARGMGRVGLSVVESSSRAASGSRASARAARRCRRSGRGARPRPLPTRRIPVAAIEASSSSTPRTPPRARTRARPRRAAATSRQPGHTTGRPTGSARAGRRGGAATRRRLAVRSPGWARSAAGGASLGQCRAQPPRCRCGRG